jgi:hypothetical protein
MVAADNSLPAPWPALTADWAGYESVTVSHLGGWLYRIFFLPGDCLLWAALTYTPPLARFLELSAADYGGVLSGFLSALVWLALALLAGISYHAVRDADRAVTQWIRSTCDDLRRRSRIARALIKQRWRERERIGAAAQTVVEEVELDAIELRALGLHGRLEPGYALTTREVALALGVRSDEAQHILSRLDKLRLITSTVSGYDGGNAYALTKVGRAFLDSRRLTSRMR